MALVCALGGYQYFFGQLYRDRATKSESRRKKKDESKDGVKERVHTLVFHTGVGTE